MSKACVFPHYFDQNHIPYYVCLYVKELSHYFDKIVVVTNKRTIENKLEIESGVVAILEVDNEGYDLGMFYKGYQFLRNQNHETIACINDSNITFGNLKFLFDWANEQTVDFWGLMDANIRPSFSNHQNNYHIQSHFLVFNKAATMLLDRYFDQLEIAAIFSVKDPKAVKRRVINDWEIGVSQYLLQNNLTCKAYLNYSDLEKLGIENSNEKSEAVNISLDLYRQVIETGVPVLKKKIITSVKPKHIFTYQNSWKRLIQKYSDSTIDVKRLIKELTEIRQRHLLGKISKLIRF